MAIKTCTITKQNFLNWYFNTGSDDEQEDARIEMGRRVIDKLLEGEKFTFSVYDAFDECETDCIPLSYLEEFDEDDGLEVGDLDYKIKVELIN